MTTDITMLRRATAMPPSEMAPRYQELLRRLTTAARTNLGFPAATDIDYRPLAPLLGVLLNNLGDPWTDGVWPLHAKGIERDVLSFFAQLFRAPAGWTGYLTSGGTEGNHYGLWRGRTRLPNAVAYHSAAAHYSVPKAEHLLGLPSVTVAAAATGEIDYTDLQRQAARFPSRPAIVTATIGTTMTEAVDDVQRIHQALDAAGNTHRYVHSDAALAGVPLAVTADRPAFDLGDGADSISISGHKFFGTPLVCGVVIDGRGLGDLPPTIRYTGAPDTSITGSRTGLGAVMLAHALDVLGLPGLLDRAQRARSLAAYACHSLQAIGWPHWRNPAAFTVMLREPPQTVRARWHLPSTDGWSHLICMPGITTRHIDALIRDLALLLDGAQPSVVERSATVLRD
ncbi:histidine decarboxylase [Actinoplanes aureus]|uniref:Histidine decarboxylase n=1 Tax=Actinoplanes aureus TaxID=2792083 RepID=A0A931G6T3_9ACTN|nr:histidine decarboxylase [Actinoplanes aureus]MBG0567539.1 histidine decarboxylase [Actinoplanes aureus]